MQPDFFPQSLIPYHDVNEELQHQIFFIFIEMHGSALPSIIRFSDPVFLLSGLYNWNR
jgi:hypothetical protein